MSFLGGASRGAASVSYPGSRAGGSGVSGSGAPGHPDRPPRPAPPLGAF
jgi:hypothetical protein